VKGGALVLLVWALLLGVNVAVMAAVFNENPTSVWLLGGAAAATALVALFLWLTRRRAAGEDPDVERPVTEVSMASALVGIALALMLLGAQFGVWLVLIGGGLLLAGVGGLTRELREERRR
jgi:drug/metabolite transporter (DMT)-like permease